MSLSIDYPGKAGQPAILLFHSLGDSAAVFTDFAKKINAAGYRLYAPTLTGHGSGQLADLFKSRLTDWQADAKQALEKFYEEGQQEVYVGGLSLGGLLALDLLLAYPGLSGGILMATPAFEDIKKSRVPYFLRQRYFKAAGGDETAAKAAFKEMDEMLNSIQAWLDSHWAKYQTIEAPLFMAQGGQDEVLQVNSVERLRRVCQAADVLRPKIYPEGSHYLVQEPTKDELARDVLEFLAMR